MSAAKISIESELLKSWGKVVQTLATTGESDIYFHVTPSSLTLSTVDSSATVFCTCAFEKSFFFRYDVPEGNINFRIPAKCLLKPFKSLKFLQKYSDSCDLEFTPDGCTLGITIICKGSVKIRHSLNLSVEAEDLQVEVDSSSLKNCIASEPKLILGSLANFTRSKGVADLTLKVLSDKLLLKNCVNDLIKREGKVYTELKMDAGDFNEYTVEVDTELTFPMREFKSFVAFAEQLKLSLALNFQGPDKPLLVTAESGRGTFIAKLILATTLAGHLASQRPLSSNLPSARIIPGSSSSIADRSLVAENSTSSSCLNSNTSAWSSPSPSVKSSVKEMNNNNNISRNTPRSATKRTFENGSVSQAISQSLLAQPTEDDMDIALIPEVNLAEEPDDENNDEREEVSRKRMRLLFPNLGKPFDPTIDVPGYNDILVECSDEEDS